MDLSNDQKAFYETTRERCRSEVSQINNTIASEVQRVKELLTSLSNRKTETPEGLSFRTTSDALATNNTAAAARKSVRSYHRRGRVADADGASIGITPDGTSSSAVKILVDAAISPRASATSARHSEHSLTCDSALAVSSGESSPSSQA